jgi:hypothetical protein
MSIVHEEFELPPKKTAEESRAEFPAVAAVVDQLREIFGSDAKVIAMGQGDRRHETANYKPDSEYGACLSPSQFIRLGEISRENTAMLAKREADRGRK